MSSRNYDWHMHTIQWTPSLSEHHVRFRNVGASGTHTLFRAIVAASKVGGWGHPDMYKYEASCSAHVRLELVESVDRSPTCTKLCGYYSISFYLFYLPPIFNWWNESSLMRYRESHIENYTSHDVFMVIKSVILLIP